MIYAVIYSILSTLFALYYREQMMQAKSLAKSWKLKALIAGGIIAIGAVVEWQRFKKGK